MSTDQPIHAVKWGESEAKILDRRVSLCEELMRHAWNAYLENDLQLLATLLGRLEITAACAQRSAEKVLQEKP